MIVGESAKTQELSNFSNTVASLKRLVGRGFNDTEVNSVEKPFINCMLETTSEGLIAAKVYHLTYE